MRKGAYELTSAARLDLLRIWNYLAEESSVGVADRVAADLEAGIQKVAQTRALGHRRAELTNRELLFYRVHSYLIVYRADKKPLNVIRVLHAARDLRSLLRE